MPEHFSIEEPLSAMCPRKCQYGLLIHQEPLKMNHGTIAPQKNLTLAACVRHAGKSPALSLNQALDPVHDPISRFHFHHWNRQVVFGPSLGVFARRGWSKLLGWDTISIAVAKEEDPLSFPLGTLGWLHPLAPSCAPP